MLTLLSYLLAMTLPRLGLLQILIFTYHYLGSCCRWSLGRKKRKDTDIPEYIAYTHQRWGYPSSQNISPHNSWEASIIVPVPHCIINFRHKIFDWLTVFFLNCPLYWKSFVPLSHKQVLKRLKIYAFWGQESWFTIWIHRKTVTIWTVFSSQGSVAHDITINFLQYSTNQKISWKPIIFTAVRHSSDCT